MYVTVRDGSKFQDAVVAPREEKKKQIHRAKNARWRGVPRCARDDNLSPVEVSDAEQASEGAGGVVGLGAVVIGEDGVEAAVAE
jgi:hypothetical protein